MVILGVAMMVLGLVSLGGLPTKLDSATSSYALHYGKDGTAFPRRVLLIDAFLNSPSGLAIR